MANTPFWAWAGFILLIFAMLVLDLGVFHRRAHIIKFKEAFALSIFWIALALLFNVAVMILLGKARGLEFLTAYLVEKSLSVDNIFVFLLIFSALGIPEQYRHRVLFWGILGALIMRGLFIGLGIAALKSFHWIVYPFGLFLIVGGVRMVAWKKKEISPEKNLVVGYITRFFPFSASYYQQKFFTREKKHVVATPLFLALIAIENADLVFAVDSIPAVLAITRDPFIAYTSNVFAILGLRALYFAVAGGIEKLRYLHVGLAAILVFVGIKMLVAEFAPIDSWISLGVITGLLFITIVVSLISQRYREEAVTA